MSDQEIRVALHFDSRSVDDSARAWLATLADLSSAERRDIIYRLRDTISSSEDVDALHVVGLGLVHLEDLDGALLAFDRAAMIEPLRPVNELNAAVALIYNDQYQRALVRLSQLAQKDHPLAEVASRYTVEVQCLLAMVTEGLELNTLQIAALEEKVSAGHATRGERISLARKHVALAATGQHEQGLRQAVGLLESLVQEDREDVQALELLISVYCAYDPQDRLYDAIAKLELLDPRSLVLKDLDRVLSNPGSPEGALETRKIEQRIADLAVLAQSEGPEREAALESLREQVGRFPRNSYYRYHLMISESNNLNHELAFKHAQVLEELTEGSSDHTLEFNLGITFWLGCDIDGAMRHFENARQLAATEQERLDVDAQVTILYGSNAK